MKLLDLFSGIGGFHKGLSNAGFDFEWVGYSEIDSFAESVYSHNFNKAEALGDITTLQTNKLPKIDICTFGFPCQDLSYAGHRKGIRANRSGLFFEAMRIIRDVKPQYIIFENVKGLLSSGGGRDFTLVLKEVADSGYDGQWQLLNTRWFLPQNRERLYFVGHLRGESRPEIFPIGEDSETVQHQLEKGQIILGTTKSDTATGTNSRSYVFSTEGIVGAIDATSYKQQKQVMLGIIGDKNSQWSRVYDSNGISKTITDGGGIGAKTGLYKVHNLQPRSPNRPSIKNKTSSGGSGPLSKEDGTTYCLDSGNSQAVEIGYEIRRLTPKECERLQGFPDGWTEFGLNNVKISDTQRYKQLGNAASVPVVEMIGNNLKDTK